MNPRITRRELLRTAPALALPLFSSRGLLGDEPVKGTRFPGMIVRMQEPRNLEFPFQHLNSWITPSEQFFVRSHFAVPTIDLKTWRLTVEGAVEQKLELTLNDIRELGEVTKPLTLECAGNGRVFLTPQARGLQWGLGAVGNAEWTGVPVSAILKKAKVRQDAVDVVFVGADSGTVAEPASPGPISFDRGLPIEKASQPEVLLAYKMNGEDLTASHGAPLRAVVGGWYGMASVKWLTRIHVTTKPHTGFWQTHDYSYFERAGDGIPNMVSLTQMQPKASIARPTLHENIPVGTPYRIQGAAWAGETKLAHVEVSVDGGKTWEKAKLTGEDKPLCWRMWEFSWKPVARGPAKLLARATDSRGKTQPEKRDLDRRTYMINHLVPIDVMVR